MMIKRLAIPLFLLALIVVSTFFISRPSSYPLVDFPMKKCAKSQETLAELETSAAEILKRGQETATLYQMAPRQTLKEITQALITHPNTSNQVKTAIANQHRYFVFTYPSDNLEIKGYISLPANVRQPIPLIILLRGGNGFFGLPHPRELSTQTGYAVVATTNRGAVSEGKDEYGGNDVNDVKNLFAFLPTLAQQLKVQFHAENKYMIGLSRGGMQLFLALERYPELQEQIKKVVSISGLLNLVQAVGNRPDFKKHLMEDFGLTDGEAGQRWLAKRQPIYYVNKLSKDLPIMIAQGTADTRVCLKEGYDMLQALHIAGHQVTYVEIEDGNHILTNTPDFTPMMMEWLEKD